MRKQALFRFPLPRVFPLPLVASLPLFLACSGGAPTGTSTTPQEPPGNPVAAATIQVQDNSYSPSTVLISAGGTVTWSWVGDNGHSVTSDGSPSFTPNAAVSFPPKTLAVVFASAGTYGFHCTVHGVAGTYGGGTMTGAVFVR